ncbi:MAG: quinone-dependent dihydroorotate dehydrogenase [Wigglesworthia glossinidia]|nr:quinone-dependent dihydroorotate dehydrogenase [Wigglesworthia glossinidia]
MLYKLITKKILSKLDPEKKQNLILKYIKYINYNPLKLLIKNKLPEKNIVCMGLNFRNILGLAAGLDKNGDYIDVFSSIGFGFIELGTVTPNAQQGAKKPRLFYFPEVCGIINKMGFNNYGIDYLLKNIKKTKNIDSRIGINIGKNQLTPLEKAKEDYLICIKKSYLYVDYITINISSPNTKHLRKLQFGLLFQDLLKEIKILQNSLFALHKKYVPILIKISPDINDDEIMQIADNLVLHNIDGVIATNTTICRNMLKEKKYPESGGLSGIPLRNISTNIIKKLNIELQGKIPIIGAGGISSVESAKEKIQSGASLIQIYSSLIFQGPSIVKKIIHEI